MHGGCLCLCLCPCLYRGLSPTARPPTPQPERTVHRSPQMRRKPLSLGREGAKSEQIGLAGGGENV